MAEPAVGANAELDASPEQRQAQEVLAGLTDREKGRFKDRQIILSFPEYFAEVIKNPRRHTRDAPRFIRDAFDFFGTDEVRGRTGPIRRFRLFDAPFSDGASAVYGQEELQNEIYRQLASFCEKGRVDKLIMIHGPNGTAKSTFVECLINGLEAYCQEPEGASYRFNWIFSDSADRSALGFHERKADPRRDGSLAHLDADDITFKLGDELKDHPLLLIPKEERMPLLERLFEATGQPFDLPVSLLHGDLCAKNKAIYQALSNAYEGDWDRIIQHVQVERLMYSQRFRGCAVVIQPQRNVDAQSRPLNLEKSYRLPPILSQSTLSELSGDLIHGNRGVIEYSDFFKRPIDLSKYLLTTSEKGSISLSDTTAYLDCVFFATSNEKNLTLFKRNPDFPSFKGRFELVRAPYLLRYSDEEKLYARRIQAVALKKHVSPHATHVTALWAVLTRLKRPSAKHYEGDFADLVTRLRPIDKARLYDHGGAPEEWSELERNRLRHSLSEIADEYDNIDEEFEGIVDAAYEGRRGASPREIMMLLHEAAEDPQAPCLSPLAILRAIREICEDRSLYEFLRLPSEAGYGDIPRLTDEVEAEYARLVQDEVHRALALVEESAYDQLFEDYFRHVKAFDSGEKILNPVTGRMEPPRASLMERVESLVGIDEPPPEFRKNLIVRIAAWVIDNPGQPVDYNAIFSDILRALRQSYHGEREEAIAQLQSQILRFGTDDWVTVDAADQQKVLEANDRLISYGYCEYCAKEALNYVLHQRTKE